MRDLDGLMRTIDYLKQRKLLADFGGMEALLADAKALFDQSEEKQPKAQYLNYLALLANENGDLELAIQHSKTSIEIWPNTANQAYPLLDNYSSRQSAE